MEKSAILKADLLDIVFEGRNKEYGAYELRRTYNRRLRLSVTVMLLLVAMLCVGHLLASRITDNESRVALVPTDHNLTDVKLPEEEPLPPPPAVKPPPPEQVRSIQVTPPKIVPDEEAPQTEVPLNEDLDNVKIDVVNRDGVDETGIVDPPKADEGKGILDVPKTPEKKEEIFTSVQIESQYVGGKKAWERFLIRNLHVPQLAIDNLIEGTVVVQFVVDKEGNVSRVEAISGPVELREEAVRVIKKSGKWTPAIQNGMQVPSYKKQPIGFRISSD